MDTKQTQEVTDSEKWIQWHKDADELMYQIGITQGKADSLGDDLQTLLERQKEINKTLDLDKLK